MNDSLPLSLKRRERLLDELSSVSESFPEEGYEEANAISLDLARSYARQIPDDIDLPCPSVDRKGNVFLQWGRVGGRFLTVKFLSIAPAGVICVYGEGTEVSSINIACDNTAINKLVEVFS